MLFSIGWRWPFTTARIVADSSTGPQNLETFLRGFSFPFRFFLDFKCVISAAYLASQGLYYHPDFASDPSSGNTLELFARISVIQAAAYCGALFLWALNSFQYVVVWRADLQQDDRPKRIFLCDLGFWGEFFNVWPSVGYFATSLWGLIVLFPVLNSGADFATFVAFYQSNQTMQLLINLAWDIGFTIDASKETFIFFGAILFLKLLCFHSPLCTHLAARRKILQQRQVC